MKIYDLRPTDYHKSFYGKALVIENGDRIQLRSYDTIVCSVVNGHFVRHWTGYSATTMRHINSFLDQCGIPGGGKAWWDRQPVEM